jgi:hypothetical protein
MGTCINAPANALHIEYDIKVVVTELDCHEILEKFSLSTARGAFNVNEEDTSILV